MRQAQRLTEAGLEFGQRLAAGPTKAHAATKEVLRAFRAGGVAGADDATANLKLADEAFQRFDAQR